MDEDPSSFGNVFFLEAFFCSLSRSVDDEIAINPYSGSQKTGDLSGIWSRGFTYAGTTYRIAYEIEENMVIPVLLCGTHENFYEQLKNIKG